MGQYDVLKDTWIYQEIKQEIQTEMKHFYLEELRQMLLEIVHLRFPRIEIQASKLVAQLGEPALLRDLLVKISTARIEKEARRSLQDAEREASA